MHTSIINHGKYILTLSNNATWPRIYHPFMLRNYKLGALWDSSVTEKGRQLCFPSPTSWSVLHRHTWHQKRRDSQAILHETPLFSYFNEYSTLGPMWPFGMGHRPHSALNEQISSNCDVKPTLELAQVIRSASESIKLAGQRKADISIAPVLPPSMS